MTAARRVAGGVVMIACLVGCRSPDKTEIERAICPKSGCASGVECPTGLLFRDSNRVVYFEGHKDLLMGCGHALSDAGLARVESSECRDPANSASYHPCVDTLVSTIDNRSWLQPIIFNGVSAQRLFIQCGLKTTRIASMRWEGEQMQVEVDVETTPDPRADRVRELCHVDFAVSRRREIIHLCRTSGVWARCT